MGETLGVSLTFSQINHGLCVVSGRVWLADAIVFETASVSGLVDLALKSERWWATSDPQATWERAPRRPATTTPASDADVM